ncbi:hypothetical protein U1Q18_040032, partial [Sarracenia purpurea var. burkii]
MARVEGRSDGEAGGRLPSRLHPLASIKVEVELKKLRTWERSLVSTNPLCAETIKTSLVGLAELYGCVEELIHSQVTKQALLQHQHGILIEDALERSIGLLDSCSVARDLLSMMKENLQDLQSGLRRKGGDSSIESNILAYTCCRKKVKKEAKKSLQALKHIKSIIQSSYPIDLNQYLLMVIEVLREVTSITISVLRSLLLFLSVPASKIRPSGWSLISKLVLTRTVALERGLEIFNEVGSVDLALQSLRERIRRNDAKIDVQMERRRLQAFDASLEGLEDTPKTPLEVTAFLKDFRRKIEAALVGSGDGVRIGCGIEIGFGWIGGLGCGGWSVLEPSQNGFWGWDE